MAEAVHRPVHLPLPRQILGGVLALLLVAGGVTLWSLRSSSSAAVAAITGSGTIESEEVQLAAEIAGRVKAVLVDEGQEVQAGMALVELDDSLLRAQMQQAEAAVATARANLALLKAGVRPEEIRQAEAAVQQAMAQRDAARRAWEHAEEMRRNPQELQGRIESTAAQLRAAQARLEQMQTGGRPEEIAAAQAALDQAQARLAQLQAGGRAEDVAAAEAVLRIAQTRLEQLKAGARSEEQRALRARVEAARSQLAAAQVRLQQVQSGARPEEIRALQAALDQAKTRLAQLRDGLPRPEDVRAAEAQVQQAQANLLRASAELDAARAREPVPLQGITQTVLDAQVVAAERAVDAARAQVIIAQANLDKVRSGPTPWDIRLAEEAIEAAQANLDRARQASPFDVRLAQEQVVQAQAALEQVQAQLDAAVRPSDYDVRVAEEQVRQAEAQLEKVRHASEFDIAAAQAAVEQAQAQLELRRRPFSEQDIRQQLEQVNALQATLHSLIDMRRNPLAANAQVDAARGQYEAAEAAVQQAQARLEALRNGPTAEQIAVAEAQVQQAEAALAVLQAQLEKTIVRAPSGGIVTRRAIQPGEMATPGMPLLATAQLSTVKVTIYVPEGSIGRVRLGQEVELTVDTFPERRFRGQVVYIAPRTEFTPRNVQTPQERVRTVVAVKVQIPNPDLLLKPGMFADARLLA